MVMDQSLEKLGKKSSPKRDAIGVTRSPYIRIRKNVENQIDDVIAIQGGKAQLFIEEEVEGWEYGIFHLAEVRYKRGDEESLLKFNFRPKKFFETETPRVLVIFRRNGKNEGDNTAVVEQFYIPFNGVEGQVPEMYYGIDDNVASLPMDEHGVVGLEKYHEALGLELELDDLT
jgi:hypothetical protein